MIIPAAAHMIENITENIITDLKLLYKHIADNAGNMISAEISSDPTRFMARTIVIAVTIASKVLYSSVFTPEALENGSSNVIANI